MNILNISESDAGGAGIAALRVHNNLVNFGINSKLLVLKKSTSDDNVVLVTDDFIQKPRKLSKIKNKTLKLLKIRKSGVSDQKYCFNGYERKTYFHEIIKSLPFQPDAIILYWVTYFLNSEDIFNLYKKTKAPIFWYFMDMAPMTGGCHYAWDCNGYKNACGKCPAIYSLEKNDITFTNLKKKKENFDKTNIIAIVASEMLRRQLIASTIFKDKPNYKIPLGIDPKLFYPSNKKKIRKEFHLPIEAKIIYFGAESFDNERKGIKYLLEALNHLKKINNDSLQNQIHLLISAEVSHELLDVLPFPFSFLGRLRNEEDIAKCYQAADIFVCPSVEDSGPMMINEAIMSGTPVVAFEMGVSLDLVHTGVTGYRANFKNSADLAKGMNMLLNLTIEEANNMSNACRSLGLKILSPNKQVKSLVQIISETQNININACK